MKQKALEKMAAKDAAEFGFAQMFFGEGAGTRRKLIEAVINERVNTIPGYEEALNAAYSQVSQVEMAEKALAHRKNLDRMNKAGKNLRAFRSGNFHNLTNGVAVVVGVAYLAHATGLDKEIKAEGEKLYRKVRTEVRYRKARAQGRNVSKII